MKQTLRERQTDKHTLEYSSSPRLCDLTLNSPEEKGQCVRLETSLNPAKRNLPEKTQGQGLIPAVYVFSKWGPLGLCSNGLCLFFINTNSITIHLTTEVVSLLVRGV